MDNRIVAIVGMCGSGKSVAADVFTARGWQKIYFGGVTMDRLEQLGLERNEKNECEVREALRREHGPAAFAKLLLPKILSDDLFSRFFERSFRMAAPISISKSPIAFTL